MWVEVCRECEKPFVITGGRTGPIIDREEIDCPHCGANWGSERIADVFHTRPLTSVELKEWQAERQK